MSIEIFNQMEKIKKLANNILFLDGSHPAIGDKYEPQVEKIRSELESLEKNLKRDLASAYVKASSTKKIRRTKPKAV